MNQQIKDRIHQEQLKLINASRVFLDFQHNKVGVNSALFSVLGKPDNVGLYFNENQLIISSNGCLKLSKNLLEQKYLLINTHYLLTNMRLIFNLPEYDNERRYKVKSFEKNYYSRFVKIDMG